MHACAHANNSSHHTVAQECENLNDAYGESHKHSGLLLTATGMFRDCTAHAACMHVITPTASTFGDSSSLSALMKTKKSKCWIIYTLYIIFSENVLDSWFAFSCAAAQNTSHFFLCDSSLSRHEENCS